ncbi:MAG: dihydropteroate synthase [Acidobacteriota bacterium]
MGVVNITPDSFSDGGRWLDPQNAVDHALRLVEEGAEILDLGAESTRPGGGVYGDGCAEVAVDEELRRLLPVLERLRLLLPEMILSVDTRKGPVARAVLEAGADWINDVGGLADDDLLAAVAEADCPVVAMHSRGDLATMQRRIHFDDVVAEVRSELAAAVERAVSAGVGRDQIILDPGIGFGKTLEHNLALLRHTPDLVALGHPVLVGASRKSFIAKIHDAPPDRRLGGSLAAAAAAARGGASILRVHDVFETVQLLKVLSAIE